MKRKDFLRNVFMGIAISLVPKSLQPFIPEVVEESSYCKGVLWHIQNDGVVMNYTAGSFTMNDLNDLFQQLTNQS